jgi:cystathionine beta-lyase
MEPPDFDAVDPAIRRQGRGEKWLTFPEDVLPLWVADMDFPLAEPIHRELRKAVDQHDVGYPVHPAPTDLPEVCAGWVERRFGWEVVPSRIELITDVMQGVYVALDRFSAPGDGVVLQTPIYPPLIRAVEETGRRLIDSPLVETERGFEVDLVGLDQAARGARILVLSHPHNPTGRSFSRRELEGIAGIAAAHDLFVVSDEIHWDLVYSGVRHVPFASLSPDVEARTLTLTSASKTFNIAGLRVAVAIFGSDAMRKEFRAVPRRLRGGLGILGLEATRAAWLHGGPWLEAALAYLEANRDFLAETVVRELPGVVHTPPEATYLAWLDCRALGLQPSPQRFFHERARVGLSDGAAFGRPGIGFVRVNFATSRAILREALERMAKALREA